MAEKCHPGYEIQMWRNAANAIRQYVVAAWPEINLRSAARYREGAVI